MTRFVVLVDSDVSVKGRSAITKKLRELRLGWWHWMQFAWLVSDSAGRDAHTLLNELQDIPLINSKSVFVTEVDPLDWSAFLKKDAIGWLERNWS